MTEETKMKIYRYVTGPIMVNTYLAYDDNNIGFVVDPGGPSRQLNDKIRDEHIDVQYILLTHGHGDHIGGIDALKEVAPHAITVGFAAEAPMFTDPNLNSSRALFGREITVKIDKYVGDNEHLRVGDMDLTFLHTPGHTIGGMCILAHGYCFSGDTLFRCSIGRTDFYGGSFSQIIESIRKRLFVLPDDTIVLSGHTEQTTIGFEKENNPFVR